MPRAPANGSPKGNAVICDKIIYKNSVTSVETGMGMEGQIMCIEKCTYLMSSVAFLNPQNAPKSLAAEAG